MELLCRRYVFPIYKSLGLDADRINQIIIGGVVNGHVAAKYVFVRLFRKSNLMHRRDWTAWGIWTGIVLGLWIIAWIIAEAIPVFNNLLSLVVRWDPMLYY